MSKEAIAGNSRTVDRYAGIKEGSIGHAAPTREGLASLTKAASITSPTKKASLMSNAAGAPGAGGRYATASRPLAKSLQSGIAGRKGNAAADQTYVLDDGRLAYVED